MKNLAWLLPCWVWKYCFAQLPRERVLLDGRTRFLIRLDEEFALVYDPQGKAMLPKLYPSESKDPRYRANSSFRYLRKAEACVQPDVEGASSCEPVVYGIDPVLARKVIKEAQWIISSIH